MNSYTFIKLYINKCTIPWSKIKYFNGKQIFFIVTKARQKQLILSGKNN